MALPVSCPLCYADSSNQVIESRVVAGGSSEHGYFRCLGCDVRFLWPRLNAEEEQRFYRDEFAVFMQLREGAASEPLDAHEHRRRNESLRLERMERLDNYLPDSGAVLEVGCASGFMMLPLQELGYMCAAVEPSGVFRKDLNARGLRTYASMDEVSSEIHGKFDLIMHYFVLEHVGDPTGFLSQQLDLLAPGGHVVFEIPCGDDALLSMYNLTSFRDFYFQIGHQWVFTPQSLEKALQRLTCTFEIIPRQRYGLANHLTWIEHGRPGGNPRLEEVLGPEVDATYKASLVKAGSADTLVVVLSK